MSKQLLFNSLVDLFLGLKRGQINVGVDLPKALFLLEAPRSAIIGRKWYGQRAELYAVIEAALLKAEDEGRVEWHATEAMPYTTRTAFRNLLVRNRFPGAAAITERHDQTTMAPLPLTPEALQTIVQERQFAIEPFTLTN